jgi:hypothetical protein
MKVLVPVFSLLLTVSASADTLGDVRAALASLQATTPARATFETQRSRKAEGRFANNQSNGGMTVSAAIDANGLQLTFPADLLAKANKEANDREADSKASTGSRAAIAELDATSVAESLDFRESLLRLLSIAKLQTETRVTWRGVPARLLVMKLTPKLSKDATSIFHVNFSQDQLNLWIANDNLPLAAERVQKGSAGFLFLRGEMTAHESWTFAHVNDRLVVARYENAFAGSGFGQKGEGKTVQTVTMR